MSFLAVHHLRHSNRNRVKLSAVTICAQMARAAVFLRSRLQERHDARHALVRSAKCANTLVNHSLLMFSTGSAPFAQVAFSRDRQCEGHRHAWVIHLPPRCPSCRDALENRCMLNGMLDSSELATEEISTRARVSHAGSSPGSIGVCSGTLVGKEIVCGIQGMRFRFSKPRMMHRWRVHDHRALVESNLSHVVRGRPALGAFQTPLCGARGDILLNFPRRLVMGDVSVIHPDAAWYAAGR
jgi:hypothetical protein